MLAYGTTTDAVDGYNYIRIGKCTAIESLKRFYKRVVTIFGDEYMRRSNNVDVAIVRIFLVVSFTFIEPSSGREGLERIQNSQY